MSYTNEKNKIKKFAPFFFFLTREIGWRNSKKSRVSSPSFRSLKEMMNIHQFAAPKLYYWDNLLYTEPSEHLTSSHLAAAFAEKPRARIDIRLISMSRFGSIGQLRHFLYDTPTMWKTPKTDYRESDENIRVQATPSQDIQVFFFFLSSTHAP